MKEHPIIFSTPMVQAILDGRKTMTRRVVKPTIQYTKCPYGQPGDILWVRERFCNMSLPYCDPEYIYFTETLYAEDYDPSEWTWKPSIHMPRKACRLFLEIVSIRVEKLHKISKDDAIREGIEVVDDSYNDDQIYRNYDGDGEAPSSLHAKDSFMTLWSRINGWDSWYKNPLVWVIEFKRREDYK
jgi:hypothetical protein